MRIPLVVFVLCLSVCGCTDHKAVKTAAVEDRYKMFNGGVGGSELAFLYDTQTGQVWRYFRNKSERSHRERRLHEASPA